MRENDRGTGAQEAVKINFNEIEHKVATSKSKASLIRKSTGGWKFASLLLGLKIIDHFLFPLTHI